MTRQYQAEQLWNAQAESRNAHERYDAAKTKTARRTAAEDLEFWNNKVAFLANVKG